MTSLFLAPATDRQGAYYHFEKTVINGVMPELYSTHTEAELGSAARIWGISSSMEPTWSGVAEEDWILFYTQKNEYQYAVQVVGKEHNPELGDTIRKEILEDVDADRDWDLLLYLRTPISISITGDDIANLFDYDNSYPVRFIRVTRKRLKFLEAEYGTINAFINKFQK
jgi:hypothetical protein